MKYLFFLLLIILLLSLTDERACPRGMHEVNCRDKWIWSELRWGYWCDCAYD